MSRHFVLERLADGAWAAVHRIDPPAPDAWAISNAGIVDLGGRTLVFDAFMTADAAAELCAVAEELTGRPPGVLVYSHAHDDHTWGGGAFADVTVIASAGTRAALLADGPAEIAAYRDVVADRLAHWRSATTWDDPVARRDAPFFLPYWEGLAATLPSLELRIPDITFEGRVEVHGRDRRVELAVVGPAHTASDVFMTLPDAGIAFCGDLLFVGCHPYLADGDVAGLREALAALEAAGAELFVPGHGPVGRAGDIRVLGRYLEELERLEAQARLEAQVRSGAQQGLGTASLPAPYERWALRRFFAANLEFVAAGGRQPEQVDGEVSG